METYKPTNERWPNIGFRVKNEKHKKTTLKHVMENDVMYICLVLLMIHSQLLYLPGSVRVFASYSSTHIHTKQFHTSLLPV